MPDATTPPPFKPYRGLKPYVFVSYAHKDREAVFAELARLHGEGHRIWYDEGIDPGNEWPQEIAQALDSAAFFLLFVSRNSVNSVNVRNEVNFALNRGKDFLAVHLEETLLPSGLELRMGDLQAILRWRMTSEEYEQKLKVALPFELRSTEGEEPAVYFSMSTIANDQPGLEFTGRIDPADPNDPSGLVLHEDEWRQTELFAGSRLGEIGDMANRLAAFEADNRHGEFWSNIFVRDLPDMPVVPGPDAVAMIAGDLGVEVRPGPILYGRMTGRVAQGFTLKLADGSALYGQAGSQGIAVLGARVGADKTAPALMDAFRLLHALYGLFLVDWRMQIVLIGVSQAGDIQVARPRPTAG